MAPLEWSEVYRTGLPRLDTQHQEIFRLINQVGDPAMGVAGQAGVANVLRFLAGYVGEHFAEEERCTRASQYPDISLHETQHEAMTHKMVEFYRSFSDGRAEVGQDVARFLSEALTAHIIQSDVPFLRGVKTRWGDVSQMGMEVK